MSIAVVNTGSTSVKLSVIENEKPIERRTMPTSPEDPRGVLRDTLTDRIKVIAHRVVHGGPEFGSAVIIDGRALAEIERLADFAPLHNPLSLKWIKAAQSVFPGIPQVAVFDTGYYQTLPERASRYALPRDLADRFHVRRYGFHGLAHASMHEQWCALRPKMENGGRLITLQLGGGSSITAMRSGAVMDTSMGFSPLEGLVMATRSGDIDFAAAAYMGRKTDRNMDAMEKLLNEESGLLGLSQISGDMAELLASHEPAARLAIDVYCHRARKYLGAYLAVLGGADGIVFGGGVGENAPAIRAHILRGMEWAGIHLDTFANEATRGRDGRISTDESAVEVRVAIVDEERVIVREARRLLCRTEG